MLHMYIQQQNIIHNQITHKERNAMHHTTNCMWIPYQPEKHSAHTDTLKIK